MRAKQLLGGAKPRVRSKSKNLIRIAQEEVKKGLVDFEIVKGIKEEKEAASDSDGEMYIGEDLAPEFDEEPDKKDKEKETPEKS